MSNGVSPQFNPAPTWANPIQSYFTAAAGRPASIGCMQQSQYQIDLSQLSTFSGPDPTGGGYATCGLAILNAVTPQTAGGTAYMPEAGSGDRMFAPAEIATFALWCGLGYPAGAA